MYKETGTYSPANLIIVDHENNTISFKLQDGPIREAGLNGCQVDDLIKVAYLIIEGLNKKFTSEYNENALESIFHALSYLNCRTLERQLQGVEGTSK